MSGNSQVSQELQRFHGHQREVEHLLQVIQVKVQVEAINNKILKISHFRKKANLWSHTYCFTAAQMETKVRTMKSGLSVWSLKHYRRCQQKRPSVRLKRLPVEEVERALKNNNNSGSSSAATIHPVKVKNKARKSFSGYRRSRERDPLVDKVIEELLEDSDDETVNTVTIKHVEKVVPNNQIVTFATGFRTCTEKLTQIKEEADMDTGVKNVTVPRPLPELQKIYVKNPLNSALSSQKQEIDIVDLCSDDE